tara:strand:+ start:844 stop:1197 length:354 start_codon:yes stop_codon:yes gene_type:complete
MITKETIFAEFKIAKEKDLKLSKTPEPYENVFTNRIALLKSHRDAKKNNRYVYRNLDINFDNLILAYSSPVPVDHFYKKGFGLSYGEYLHKKKLEEEAEKKKDKIIKEKDVKEVTIN